MLEGIASGIGQAILNAVLNTISGLISVILYPINLLITRIMPSISTQITEIFNNLDTVFNVINWALGLIPAPLLTTLVFILTIEVAKHTIFISTRLFVKLFTLIAKLKFW